MAKLCAICEKEASIMDRRKIANDDFLCMDCFKKATSLTTKQMLKLKTVTADEIRESIIKSGHKIKKHTPPTLEELEEQLNPTIKCPKCASKNLQFMQNNKKAFSVGKAAGGAILTGGVGALAGFAGKKGDDQWRCNNCGDIFTTKNKK
ncbi:DUF4428 domain-containing protein [Sporosarcina sp. FSL K6-3457]|uniref:DUF4428 domain-containing protein n=1 Tax=Sporosarcina sp. FSL K6-3457 TaxID=2978204 RepID=UPI0030F53BF5